MELDKRKFIQTELFGLGALEKKIQTEKPFMEKVLDKTKKGIFYAVVPFVYGCLCWW